MANKAVRRSLAVVAVAFAAIAACLGWAAPVAGQSGGFDDVSDDAYYWLPVTTLAGRGVFEGTLCGDGFCPGEPIDRKTMAVWVVRVLDGRDPPAVSEARFDDVDAASFYAPFVERMADLGVTAGCGDGSGFCPDRTVTRAQMAVFLSRAYSLPAGADPMFSDVADDAWYASDVAKLAAAGITSGCGDGTRFCPGHDTTRAQMATFLLRGLDWRLEAGSLSISEGPRGNDTLISASRGRTCAVGVDGTVACWGQGGLRERIALAGLRDVAAISTGDNHQFGLHACVLHHDGTISCWGSGTEGQLGQGDTSSHYLPVTVPGISDAVAVSAGGEHTCALHRDGGVSCWGYNLLGQLGDGTTSDSYLPKRVRGVAGAVAVAAGPHTSCAVGGDGTVSCWGWPYSYTPEAVDGAAGVSSLSIGQNQICAVTVDGTVDCWLHFRTPNLLTRVGNLTEVVEVSAGDDTACALHRDGGVSCWKAGDLHATVAPQRRPVRIAGVFDAVAASVSSGSPEVGPHSCVLHENGSASCWGANNLGQLGDNTTDDRQIPGRVKPQRAIPADEVPATATGLLRAWVDAVIAEREANYPWMRAAWDHIRNQTWAVQSGFGGFVHSNCHASADSFGCTVDSMHITAMSLGTVVHELLHVYDLHTGLAPSTAWGAVQLYFATTHPGCWADTDTHGAEILADTVSHAMVPAAWLTYYNSPDCPTMPVGSKPTPEAQQVVLEGMAGKVPTWYRANITNGAELWAAWLQGPSLPALANLADEFGGLCTTDWITYPLDPALFPPADTNPFRDGGC